MTGWRGLLAGVLGLAFLELVVRPGSAAPGRLGALVGGADGRGGIGDVVRRILSPGVALFPPPPPPKSSGGSSGGSGGGGGGGKIPIPLPLPGRPIIPVPNPFASYPASTLT